MTQQEIRLELLEIVGVAPEELLLAEKFVKGSDNALGELIEKRNGYAVPSRLKIVPAENSNQYNIIL